jgi:hypothetical protein
MIHFIDLCHLEESIQGKNFGLVELNNIDLIQKHEDRDGSDEGANDEYDQKLN